VPADVFRESVTLAAKSVEPEIFSLLGGEPLLHPDLLSLIFIAKESGISSKIQVTTNGKLLHKMPPEFWSSSFDLLRVTRYPGQISDEEWDGWKRKARENGKGFHGGMNSKFYKPYITIPLTKASAAERFSKCPWKDHCTTLDLGFLYLCPQAVFFPLHFREYPIQADGLNLEEADAMGVLDYMKRTEPLNVCSRCSYTEYAGWKQTPRQEWMEESKASK